MQPLLQKIFGTKKYTMQKSWGQAKTANCKLEGSLSTCPQPL